MKQFRHKNKFVHKFPSYGLLTYASFIICIISGVIVAISYNINAPGDSITLMLIKNPLGSIF